MNFAPALLLRWISSFLSDRTVKVRILGHTSREIAITYVVPQGSPISPLLFLLYMSKFPKLLPNTRRSLFADDFMIYSEYSIARSHLIQSNLQTSMDALTLFNSDHRIILSCTKSVRVLFEGRKCNMVKPQDINYNGQVIPSSSSVKFLGITFDSALNFRSRFRTVATLAHHRLLKLTLSSLQPMAALPLPSSASTNPTSVLCLIRCASYMRSLSRHTTLLGEDTNSFHFASTFHSILHPHRQKTAARLPSIHP